MTRENKLALVVGFALILVVGILISDHFSAARSQRSAELGQIVDPTVDDPYSSAELVRYDNGPNDRSAQRSEMLVQTDRLDASGQQTFDAVRTPPQQLSLLQQQHLQTQPSSAQQPRGSAAPMRVSDPLNGQQPPADASAIRLDEQHTRDLPFLYHHVAPNETLTAICERYYGDTSLIKELAEFNDIENPDRVPRGMRLRIPAAEHLIRGERLTAPQSDLQRRLAAATAPRHAERTYTVKKGDTLGEIAQKTLGSASKWRTLYEYNKDVIDDPDTVVVGTTLKIPPR